MQSSFILGLCVTITYVLSFKYLSIIFVIFSSDTLSKLDVGSSKKYKSLSIRIPLMIFNLCFCPAESLTPFSPTNVSNPSGRLLYHSKSPASFNKSSIFSIGNSEMKFEQKSKDGLLMRVRKVGLKR